MENCTHVFIKPHPFMWQYIVGCQHVVNQKGCPTNYKQHHDRDQHTDDLFDHLSILLAVLYFNFLAPIQFETFHVGALAAIPVI